MKTIVIVILAVLLSAEAIAQKKNVYWTARVEVKLDKWVEYEKKLPVFLKTHYPSYNIRIFSVLTGDHSTSYIAEMGPLEFKDFDTRPTSPKGQNQMNNDSQTVDALTLSWNASFYRKVEDISNNNPDRKLNFVVVRHFEIEMGSWDEMHALLLRMKEARIKHGTKGDNEYLRPAESGQPNRFVRMIYLEKLEHLDEESDVTETYNKLFGSNALYKDTQRFYSLVKSVESEIRVFRPDLSSLGTTPVASAK